MDRKIVQEVVIGVLLIIIGVIYFQRQPDSPSSGEEFDPQTSDTSTPTGLDPAIKVGNCFSYKINDRYYGFVIVEVDLINDNFYVAFLNRTYSQNLATDDFVNGRLVWQKYSDSVVPDGAEGFFGGFFFKNEIGEFKRKFTYVDHIDLNPATLVVAGGGQLILEGDAIFATAIDGITLEGIKQLSKPMTDFM